MNRAQIRKLCSMSRGELRARSTALVTRWRETAGYVLGLDREPDVSLKALAEPGTAFRGPWLDRPEQEAAVAELRARHADYVDALVVEADALCRNEFVLFGTVARYGEPVAWQDDPVSGKPWPRVFHTRLRIFDGDVGHGDVKYVWELNRHQFLPVLGKAYCLTGDEKYAAAGLALLDSWVEDNPCGVGINWTSALEVAVRSLAWCWALALFERSASLTPPRRRRILCSLSEHGRYIERHLSFYVSPYNHLVGEAAALFVIGTLLPWLRRSARWRERGWAILEDEMPRQFHPDGGSVEQATGYHHFTLGFYLQAMLLGRRSGREVSALMWSVLERALEFSMHLTRPDGSTPMIGDADEGKALSLSQPDLWDFRAFLALGAVLFERADFKKVGGPFPPDAAWLVGAAGQAAYDAIGERAPKDTSIALPESGYYVMRTGWDRQAHYLAFDCGELAAGVSTGEASSAAHGHADALSIDVSAFGEPRLVDPGFWTYNGSPEWHRYFRETEAHNTVVVDGCSQAEFSGRLKWSHAPRVSAREWVTLGAMDCAEGSHSGYQRLPGAVIHRRMVIFLKPFYWVVRDELLGEGEHDLERCFHFATAEVAETPESQSVATQVPGRPNLAVVPVERDGLSLEVSRGGGAPASGWLAVGYERKVQAAVAKYRTTPRLPCALHTLIVPFREDASPVGVRLVPLESDAGSPGDRAFEVARPGGRDVWAFSGGGVARFHHDCVTDARSTCVRFDDEGRVTGCVFVSGSSVHVNGEPLLVLDRRVRGAALWMADGCPLIELSEPATIRASMSVPSSFVLRDRAVRIAG